MFIIKKYKRSNLSLTDTKRCIEIIEKELIRLEVNTIECKSSIIYFRNSFFSLQENFHLMALVDKGYFKIDSEAKEIEYSFSMARLFYLSLCFCALMRILSKSFFVVLFFFFFLFGMNLIINGIRHKIFLDKLVKQLE